MTGQAPEGPGRPRNGNRGDTRRHVPRAGAGSSRLTRTILFGTIAVVVSIAWLARELGLDREELLGYLRTSVMLVAGLAMSGLLGGLLLWGMRALWRRFKRPGA